MCNVLIAPSIHEVLTSYPNFDELDELGRGVGPALHGSELLRAQCSMGIPDTTTIIQLWEYQCLVQMNS